MAKVKRYQAKLIPVEEKHHRLAILSDMGCEVYLVRGGPRRAFIWIGDENGINSDTISGEKALRALAEAILAELDGKK